MLNTHRRPALACVVASIATACGLVDVSDPTALEEEDLTNATSSEMLRGHALAQFYRALPYVAVYGALMSDELYANPSTSNVAGVSADEAADRRWSAELETVWTTGSGTFTPYQEMTSARSKATTAIPHLRQYAREAVKAAYMGQLFAIRGFGTMLLAEHLCPGVPLNSVEDGRVISGVPLSTAGMLEAALADFDSAMAYATDSIQFVQLAQVGRARALLGLGRFGDAATAATAVPTDYVYEAEFNGSTAQNVLAQAWLGATRSVADRDGGTGLDFASAVDPRVVVIPTGTANDGVTELYSLSKYADHLAPMPIATGLEARLIEAEAALRDGGSQWLAMLNDLRTVGTYDTQPNADEPTQTDTIWHAGTGGIAGLAPLDDPGSDEARVDLLFRERAFWLFATGHRLGDLRRLIAQYGRSSESVFPTGAYRLGDRYGDATSLPFPAALEARHNPAVTGCAEL